MGRVLMENYTAQDTKDLHNSGHKFSFLLEDDGDLFFEIPPGKLIAKVEKSKGFRVAAGHDVDFQTYTDIAEDESPMYFAKVGCKDNRDRSGRKVISSTEFDAYVLEFGISKLKIKSDINIKKWNGKEIDEVV